MRKIAFVLAPLFLASCASEPAEEPPAEEPAAEAEAAAMMTANGSAPGTYNVADPEGVVSSSVLNADGTYADMDADGNVVAEGTWSVADGKTCFAPSTEGAEPMCWTESAPGEDGSFTATSDAGDVVTVTPVMAEAEVEAGMEAPAP